MSAFTGEGWWEQDPFGRQPMHELQLVIDNGIVDVRGWDAVGPFRMHGQMNGNQVLLIKRYLGRHDVEYAGTYDGEGVMAGLWRIGEMTGRWMISLAPASNTQDDEITTIE